VISRRRKPSLSTTPGVSRAVVVIASIAMLVVAIIIFLSFGVPLLK
jgi:hypothetical protein